MTEPRLIRTRRLRNILSFGPEAETVELRPLNVIIGPNNAGKTNLVNAIGLLRATRADFAQALREQGGVSEWLWKGAEGTPIAEIDATVSAGDEDRTPYRHRLSFTAVNQRAELVDEASEDERRKDPRKPGPLVYYRYQSGRPVLSVRANFDAQGIIPRWERQLRREDLKPDQSVLSQKIDKVVYPEITYLNETYSNEIAIYSAFNTTKNSAIRNPVRTDLPGDSLLEGEAQ